MSIDEKIEDLVVADMGDIEVKDARKAIKQLIKEAMPWGLAAIVGFNKQEFPNDPPTI